MSETDRENQNKRRMNKVSVLERLADERKSYLIAAMLCAFFGFFGAHRFYLEQKLAGTIIAAIWIFILMLMAFEGLIPQLLHGIIWGYWAVLEALNEFWLFFHKHSIGFTGTRTAVEFAQYNYIRYPIIIFGLYMVLEFFLLSRKVEQINADKKRVIEAEIEAQNNE